MQSYTFLSKVIRSALLLLLLTIMILTLEQKVMAQGGVQYCLISPIIEPGANGDLLELNYDIYALDDTELNSFFPITATVTNSSGNIVRTNTYTRQQCAESSSGLPICTIAYSGTTADFGLNTSNYDTYTFDLLFNNSTTCSETETYVPTNPPLPGTTYQNCSEVIANIPSNEVHCRAGNLENSVACVNDVKGGGYVEGQMLNCCPEGWTNPPGLSSCFEIGGTMIDPDDDSAPAPDSDFFNSINPVRNFSSVQDGSLETPGGILSRFLTYFAFPLAGMLLFVMILWGGFEILIQSPTKKSIDAGRQRITAAIMGFLLLFISYWIVQLIEVIFGAKIL